MYFNKKKSKKIALKKIGSNNKNGSYVRWFFFLSYYLWNLSILKIVQVYFYFIFLKQFFNLKIV